MSGFESFALLATAAIAGAINAVAGGGTLLTFPVLLFFNTPPLVANSTSTLALVIGTAGSLFSYRQQLAATRVWLIRFIPVCLVGGLLGSWLLVRTGNATFSKLVPFLILFAAVLFMAQGAVRRVAGEQTVAHAGHPSIWIAIAFQFVVAIYGGYFGAGIGILMLASLGFLGLGDIHEMNALKTILGSLINVVAAILLTMHGLIDWPKMTVMTIGALGGYWLGAHFSQRLPQKHVRALITVIGFVMAAATFWKQFL